MTENIIPVTKTILFPLRMRWRQLQERDACRYGQSLEVASLMRSLRRILPDGFLGMDEINASLRILL